MRVRTLVGCTLVILATVCVLAFNNCSQVNFGSKQKSDSKTGQSQNTHVGNPFTSSAKTLLNEICGVLVRCNSQLTSAQCESGVSGVTGIDYQLGLATGLYSAFTNIIDAESTGALTANSTASQTCMVAVENSSCSDPAVQGAYDPSSATPFSRVPFMIPTAPGSCPAMFNQPPAREEYYVATTGSDTNDGSKDQPWATIAHASSALNLGAEGAVVHVAPGTYSFAPTGTCPQGQSPCSIYTVRSGTASAPITYISDQQGGAKLAPSGANTIWFNKGDYVKIIGFEMIGTATTSWGIYQDGAYGEMIGNHIHDIPNPTGCAERRAGGGIVFGYYSYSHDNDAIGNLIHDLGPNSPNGLATSSYCYSTAGIDYQQPGGKVHNNIIYRSGTFGIRTFHSAKNLQIANNLIFAAGYRDSGGNPVGAAINIAGEPGVGTIDDTSVSNNILRNNFGYGLMEDGQVGQRNVYASNVIFGNTLSLRLHSGVTPQNTITSDPLMVNFQIDGSGNYRLQSNSPAIDAATNICPAVVGNGNCTPGDDYSGFHRSFGAIPDIGPFEWHP